MTLPLSCLVAHSRCILNQYAIESIINLHTMMTLNTLPQSLHHLLTVLTIYHIYPIFDELAHWKHNLTRTWNCQIVQLCLICLHPLSYCEGSSLVPLCLTSRNWSLALGKGIFRKPVFNQLSLDCELKSWVYISFIFFPAVFDMVPLLNLFGYQYFGLSFCTKRPNRNSHGYYIIKMN